MSDRLLAVIGLAVGVALIWGATLIQTGFIVDPLGPRMFPIIIGAVLVIASAYPLVRPDPEPAWPGPRRALEVAAVVAVMIVYALLLEPLGFVIATALAASALSFGLGSRPAGAAIAGVAISLGIYVVFHLILGLSLARGPLGF